MGVYFLLYIEDTDNKSDGRVDLFLNDEAAQSAMEADYARTLQALRFNTDSYSGDHYCKCQKSFAIIADGENFYSWSIGRRKHAGAADCLAASGGAETVNAYPSRRQASSAFRDESRLSVSSSPLLDVPDDFPAGPPTPSSRRETSPSA